MFLVIIVTIVGMIGLNAQSMESLQIGARAGYNNSILRGDVAKGLDFKGNHGYHLGLFVEIPLTDRFSIQPEMIYSIQGAKTEIDVAGIVKGTTKLKSQNLNVPVLAKIYLVDGLNLQVGPQIGFYTGNEFENNTKFLGKEDKSELKLPKEVFSKVNLGAVLGLGYKMDSGFTIDARYNYGLTNVFTEGEDNEFLASTKDKTNLKNSVFSIGVGFQF